MMDIEEIKRVIDKGKEINQRHLAASGMAFLQGGIQLFPSDYLRDDQMVVSRAMYDATVKACAEQQSEKAP